MSTASHPTGIVGSGTMGSGIAQCAAMAGWTVRLHDVEGTVLEQALKEIRRRLDRLIEKDRMSVDDATEAFSRVEPTTNPDDLADCDLIVEAIVEDLDIKATVLSHLAKVTDAVLATNTSSLSVTALGKACGAPGRVVGMHFFNPAPIMPLVEIVRGNGSDETSIQRATLLAEAWGKTVVQVADTPGFIVNRVARPYYLEAWRVVEDAVAGVDAVDSAMQSLGEFRMGPFELTDLIGQDVNTATTSSVWDRLGRPSRLAPSVMQERLVERGHLGRKSGCGAYAHDDRNSIVPAILVDRQPLELSDRLRDAVNQFCLEASPHGGTELDRYIFARVLASIMNEAQWAVADGIASAADIDTAMQLGTNYPRGPLAWADHIGTELVSELLSALGETVDDGRFAQPEAPVTSG